MDFLNFLGTMGESPVSVIAAFFIGLMTAISPCPLATNITAIAYISKKIDSSRHTLLTGFVYTLGRMAAYVTVASAIVFFGMNIQIVALGLQHYGERLLGPFLILCGIYLLDIFHFSHLPGGDRVSSFTSGISVRLAEKGYLGAFLLGVIFALSFCPFSAVLFFAMLIPLALGAGDPVIIPAVFALATGLPVIVISYLLVKGVGKCSGIVQRIGAAEHWIRRGVAAFFIVVGCVLYRNYLRQWNILNVMCFFKNRMLQRDKLRGNTSKMDSFSRPDIFANTGKTRKSLLFVSCGEYAQYSLCLPK